jgi:hypothetical protein
MSQKFVVFLKILLSFSGRENLNPHLVLHCLPHLFQIWTSGIKLEMALLTVYACQTFCDNSPNCGYEEPLSLKHTLWA